MFATPGTPEAKAPWEFTLEQLKDINEFKSLSKERQDLFLQVGFLHSSFFIVHAP